MSWLFGVGGQGQSNDPLMPNIQLPTPPSGGDDGGDDKSGQGQGEKQSKMEAYRFDSAALERAAKAAKELEGSSM